MSASFHEERMLKMMEQLPQNSEEGYNAVIPIVEWEFSQTGDPTKDRRRNIKNATVQSIIVHGPEVRFSKPNALRFDLP